MRLLGALLTGMLAMTVVPAVAAPQAEAPAATVPAPAAHPKARLHHLVGEVMTVDQAAKTLTVKQPGKQAKELTLAVDDKVAAMLADLHPGDQVRIRYSDKDGKLDAMAIKVTHKAKA
jgi:Cu/Ag efflux protein CusF